ncbi:uncharacterized protein ATNIH1004_011809 [Aspergillus tanneri]|uniref:Uncharacterized protein n=1 Tax=Aspergillus tanneri TaxID=1220188 RepID=A0A5M9M9S4_9EURO|nr:uncharacterized protein ATNIH1004_011809 [Aspergillus tanneri]KAA8641673.1 hypothetical protein ATNIH1004_011809 [Aspergillus tanneri]
MVQEEWFRLFQNFEFAQTLLDFQKVLNQYQEKAPYIFRLKYSLWSTLPRREQFVNSAADSSEHASNGTARQKPDSPEIEELTSIIRKLASSKSAVRTAYAKNMKDSLAVL